MRYDVRDRDGALQKRGWNPLNTPVLDGQGRIRYIMHQAYEVTANDLGSDDVAMAG